jgi:hypothetical protein
VGAALEAFWTSPLPGGGAGGGYQGLASSRLLRLVGALVSEAGELESWKAGKLEMSWTAASFSELYCP